MARELKPLVHQYTVGMLVRELSQYDPDMLVSLAGCLRLMRVKQRGPDIVDLEAAESTSRDPYTGEVTVQLLD